MNGPPIGSQIEIKQPGSTKSELATIVCKRPIGDEWQAWARVADGEIISFVCTAADLEGRRTMTLGPVDLRYVHQLALNEIAGKRSPHPVCETTRLLALAVLHFTNQPQGAVK